MKVRKASRSGLFRGTILLLQLAVLIWPTAWAHAENVPPKTLSEIAEFFHGSCMDCHQGAEAAGGLDLTRFTTPASVEDHFASWVRIVDRVQDGEMPPPDSEQPHAESRDAFLARSTGLLNAHQQSLFAAQGRVRGRRLTNLQLERSLHELLGIDIPLASLMSDEPRTAIFATVANGQAMSHFQLEQHLRVVDAALDEAFSRAARSQEERARTYAAEEIARDNPRRRCREPEMIDNDAVVWASRLTFYGRLPVTTARQDGWFRFRIRVSCRKPPKDGGVWCTVRTGPCISSAPLLNWVTAFEAFSEPREVTFDAWLPRGHMLEVRPGDTTLKMARFAGGQVGAGEGEPQDVPGLNLHELTVERIHPGQNNSEVRNRLFGALPQTTSAAPGQPNKSSDGGRRTITTEDIGSESAVEEEQLAELISTFAERAFRRPLTAEDIAPFIDISRAELQQGEPVESALRTGYRAILCSPRFLYFYELPGRLDDYALATRLSYFLWNSPPDQELMQLADEDRLHEDDALSQQVDRMLADERGRNFIVDLTAEWLDLRLIDFTEPDPRLYPTFDSIVQQSMLLETHAFLQDLLDRNSPITEMIESDRTFLNSRLARFYGIDNVQGDNLRAVQLRSEDHRGGLLTHGSVLKVTANGTTTSPVIRGVWVGERILGEHLPPPPDSVPAIEPDIRGATSIRELLERHRNNDGCASCHVKIDPPGFALENYDPAGQYRTYYGSLNKATKGKKILVDSSYTTRDGQQFENAAQFFALVTRAPEKLAANFAAHLITCGTGARPEFADRVQLQQIVTTAATDNYGMKSLLRAVVQSDLFRSK